MILCTPGRISIILRSLSGYKLDVKKIEDDKIILGLKDLNLELEKGKDVLVDLDKDSKYDILTLYVGKVANTARVIIKWLPPDLQNEIYKVGREKQLKEQEELPMKSEVVFWSIIGKNSMAQFDTARRTHQIMLKEVGKDKIGIEIDNELHSFELNKSVKLDLDKNNILDTIVTYQKYVEEEQIRLKVEEITQIEKKIDEKSIELQHGLPVSTKNLFDAILGVSQYGQKIVLGESGYHRFNLNEINLDNVKLKMDDKVYTLIKAEPLRIDLNGDGVLDVVVTYVRHVGRENARITVKEITAFNPITTMAVQEVIKEKIPYILTVLGFLVVITVIIGFLRFA